ncbi:uncharacterized protein LTHEOB_10629 [Lasiodiplodia theobromae]|uniref:uncharacterized protein n=1 Tax=Lasiodiplodia theobromae TaxID=45133 RepID=UPI0015C34C6C|nr:uncharacterized protein LTHEOB_10629 [Lasiodiplodia theobromae]KAF4538538.1 hypothetical protein LTHEOB_10629 [Lasiodiplodia theobromae]
MNSYEIPKDQAAAYHLGKLDAQLRAEREARIRAEQTVACLLGLRVDEHGPPAASNLSGSGTASKSDTGLLQQRLEELRLEVELERLKAKLHHDKRPGSNAVLGGVVHASPAKMEDALPPEMVIDPPTVYNSSEQFAKRAELGHQDRSEETDIPAAEWMHPTKKEERKPKEPTKSRHKSYFAPSSAAAPGDVTAVEESAEVHAPEPVRPTVSAKSFSQTQHRDETTRFGRFERDQLRPPRSHGRPPPNPRPFYPGYFPQPWPPQISPRPYFGGSKLISYADLDRPVEAPLPLHEQPSSGYLDFSEDLYDEPSASKVDNKKATATSTPSSYQLVPESYGLKRSIHARSPYWPIFKSALHNHRHVDVTNILSIESIPGLMEQASKSYLLLSVTPPKKTVCVVSPTEVATSYALTLEFARGDAAADFVRSTEYASPREKGCSNDFKATQHCGPSPPIPIEIGEVVWRGGASRTLVIEDPGAALRVPANLRYQIEHCPYTTSGKDGGKGGGSAGGCDGRLQDPPEFLQDGSIRLVFWDIRDAVVAYKKWTTSPLFKRTEISYERYGVLPELEGEEDGEGDPSAGREDMARGIQESDGKHDEDPKNSETSGKDIETHGAMTSAIASVGIEREEDDGYAAGSSEDMENSVILSPKCSISREEPNMQPANASQRSPIPTRHQPAASPRRRIGVYLSSHEHDLSVESTTEDEDEDDLDRDATRHPAAGINHNTILNYDGTSDDIEEGEIREPPAIPAEKLLTSGTIPQEPDSA